MPLCPAVQSALSSSCWLFDVFSDKLNDDDDDEDDDDACCCYRYYLVYMILVVHGVGVLMPWNMFINANDVRLSALVLSAQVRHGMCL